MSWKKSKLLLPLLLVAMPSLVHANCPADSYGIYALEEIDVKKRIIFNGATVPEGKTPNNRAIALNGTIVTPSPAIVLPALPSITFVNSPDANGSLSPDSYGTWVVNAGAVVTMAPGIYNIDEVDIKDDAIITISPAGPVIINVNKFDMDDRSQLNANTGSSAANLTVNYYGTSSNNDNKFHLHDDVRFTGIIFSSYDDDKVEVKKRVILKGGIFTAGEVKLEDDAIITYTAAEQAAAAIVLGCTAVTFDEPEMIAGRVTLKNTNTTAEFSEVCFDEPFSVPPLVFTLPTSDESDPALIRIKNVTTTGFEIAQVESQGTNDGSVPTTIDFVAIVAGQYNLEGGARMDVVSFSTTSYKGKNVSGSSWDDIDFSSSFAAQPAIIAAVQTMNNESGTPPGSASTPFLGTGIRNVSTSDFDFALERAETNSGAVTVAEQVGYIAIDAGVTGELIPGITYQSMITPTNIRGINTCSSNSISISPAGLPLVVASQNSRNGANGGWLRRCSLSNTNVGLVIDEDIDLDGERSHNAEKAGILALSGTFTDFTDSCAPPLFIDWHFDEASWIGTGGEVVDSSANSYHARISSGSGLNTITDGQVCRGARFDGNNDFLVSSDVFPVLGTTASMGFWIRTTQSGSESPWQAPGITGREISGSEDDIFWGWLDASGRIAVTKGNASTNRSSIAINDGSYHHVVLSRDSVTGAVRIYIDGVLSNAGATNAGDVTNSFSNVGRMEGASDYFQGDLDEVMIFDSILEDTEVASIYSNQLAGNNWDGSSRDCPVVGIDHYVITHSGSGITCDPYTVTVSAVDTDDNAVDIPAGTQLTLSTDLSNDGWSNPSGAGATYTVPADVGSVDFQLRKLLPATLEIDVVDNSNITDDDGNRDDDTVVFSDAGFIFYADGAADTIATQISGKPSNTSPNTQVITLKAVESSPSDPGVCEALVTNASADIGLAYRCDNPASCANTMAALSINSIPVNANSEAPFVEVSLNFDALGEATFVLSYADAGQISLMANANLPVTGSGGAGTANVQGNSNSFLVKPAGLCVRATQANNDCAGASAIDASCSAFQIAGVDFNLEISGRAWVNNTEANDDFCDNAVSANFISTINLASNLVQPTPGTNAVLSVSTTSTDSSGSVTQALNVDEVGVFTFTATLPSYFTETIAASSSANVGRFYPNHFELTGGVVTSANTQSSDFTYLGQPMLLDYTLRATSALGTANTTVNYTGDFAKLDLDNVSDDLSVVGTSVDVAYGAVGSAVPLSYNTRLTVVGPGATTTWSIGVINVINLPFIIERGVSPEAPATLVDVGVLVEDSDGVGFRVADVDLDTAANGGANDTVTIGSLAGNLLYGRTFIPPIFGTEIGPGTTIIPIEIQFYDGSNFVVNAQDDSSLYGASATMSSVDSPLLNYEGNLIAANLGSSNINFPDPATPVQSGRGNLITVDRPGLSNDGNVDVTFNVDNWLQFNWNGDVVDGDEDPTTTLYFGTYRGNDRIIYWQEVF